LSQSWPGAGPSTALPSSSNAPVSCTARAGAAPSAMTATTELTTASPAIGHRRLRRVPVLCLLSVGSLLRSLWLRSPRSSRCTRISGTFISFSLGNVFQRGESGRPAQGPALSVRHPMLVPRAPPHDLPPLRRQDSLLLRNTAERPHLRPHQTAARIRPSADPSATSETWAGRARYELSMAAGDLARRPPWPRRPARGGDTRDDGGCPTPARAKPIIKGQARCRPKRNPPRRPTPTQGHNCHFKVSSCSTATCAGAATVWNVCRGCGG